MEKKYVNFTHVRGVVKKVFSNTKVLKLYIETIKKVKDKEFKTSHDVVFFGTLANIINEGDWVDIEGALSFNSYNGKDNVQITATKVTLIQDEMKDDVYDPDNIPF